MEFMKNTKKIFLLSILNIVILCVLIGGVSVYFVENNFWIGFVLILLAILCLVSLTLFKVNLRSIQPDIIFGIVDNGFLAIFAIFGAHFAGIAGAILGGVVGNAITDGIAGIFEGYWAENLRNNSISDNRTMLNSAVGKMTGCLFGAGVVLILANFM